MDRLAILNHRNVEFLNIDRIIAVTSMQKKQDGKYKSLSLSLVLVLIPNATGIKRLNNVNRASPVHFILSTLFFSLFLRINPVANTVRKLKTIVRTISNR